MNAQQRKHIYEIQPFLLILLVLILYLVLAATGYGDLQTRLTTIDSEWNIGGPEKVEKKYITRYTTVLPEQDRAMDSVCFYTEYSEARVLLNNDQIYAFHKPRGERYSDSAPSIWHKVVLPAHTPNSELTVEVSTPYKWYSGMKLEAHCGSTGDVEQFLLGKTLSRFAVALGIMFIGVILCIVALILRFHQVIGNKGLYSLCMFIVVLAVYLASKQTYLLLNVYDGISYNFLCGISFMLCPVMYSRYMMRQYSGMCKKIAAWMNIISLASAAVLSILHYLHVWELPESMIITRAICLLMIVYAVILELSQHSRRVVFLLCGVIGLYALVGYRRGGSITWAIYLGLFMYISIVVFRIARSVLSTREREIRLETALDVSKSEIATIQITSHFFYHTLDSIRALIRLDADRAYKMTGDFAKYIRYRVDGVEQLEETVTFTKELRSIRAYTDIKKAQLGDDRFTIEFDVETEDFEILPLSVQPLVENSVIHAVQKRREGGLVRVVCREMQGGYFIEVIDNGPGAHAEPQPTDDQKRHTAIANVNTRLEYYGIPPISIKDNELGGKTAQITYPKHIKRKGMK